MEAQFGTAEIDRVAPPHYNHLNPNCRRPTVPENYTEEELLDLARRYSFRSRMDRSGVTGPIFVWGRGSVVRDINGKEYLDFNSGQMCAASGPQPPSHRAGPPGKFRVADP